MFRIPFDGEKTVENSSTPQSSVPYQVRQGDVLLERRVADAPVDGMKPAVKEGGLTVLAHGEVTGHSHTLDARPEGGVKDATPVSSRFWTPSGEIDDSGVLQVDQDAHLKHDTHSVLPVPAGEYNVVKQREHQPKAAPRRVID